MRRLRGWPLVRVFRYIVSAAIALGAVAEARSAYAAALPDIGGIYVVAQTALFSDDRLLQQLKKAIGQLGVDGLLVDMRWSPDIASPTMKGGEDWRLFDKIAALAMNRRKKFEIAIITGGSTPAWVFADPPQGFGAKSGSFDFIEAGKPGANCRALTEAPPWNRRYLRAFDGFLADLADHLKAAGTYSALTMLRMTGINAYTDELRLPGQTPENTGAYDCPVDNLQAWQDLGYRTGKVATAWKEMLDLYKQHYPDKVFNVALITTNAFPAFDAAGDPVYTPLGEAERLSARTTAKSIAEAGAALPGQLVVQSNGLNAGPADPTTIELARTANAGLAWQTNEWELLQGGAACGGTRVLPTACNARTFYAMLQRGIFPHGTIGKHPLKAQYLELFAPNIVGFPGAVVQAHNLLIQ